MALKLLSYTVLCIVRSFLAVNFRYKGKKFDKESLKNKASEYSKKLEAQDEATSTKLLMERRIKGFYKDSK